MSIEQQRNEFIESLGGELTPEQAAQLLELGTGDTGAQPDQVAAPTATPSGEEPKPNEAVADPAKPMDDKGAPVDESKLSPDNAVILAADGKHTISFERLVEARVARDHWRGEYETANAEREAAYAVIARLQAEANARAAAGIAPTGVDKQVAAAQAALDQGADPSLFGDYSEEALARGIDARIDQKVDQKVEAILSQKLAPFEQQRLVDTNTAHFNAIYKAHPDADSVVESTEFSNWMKSQPSYLHGTYQAILERGTTKDIIGLFDDFKKATATDATQAGQAASDPNQVKALAKQAVANAPKPVPTSLTEFPGGRPAGQTRFEQIASMTHGHDLLNAFEGMTKEQIAQTMDRLA